MPSKFWVAGGNGIWGSTTNWSLISGGASGAAIPVAGDDVFLDNLGNANCNINTVTAPINSLTITAGYTAVVSGTGNLNIVGAITFGANCTITATSQLTWSGTNVAITSNGKSWPGNFIFSGNTTTKTLVGNLNVLGLVQFSGQSQAINATINERVICNNGLSVTGSMLSGSAKITLKSGTWSGVNTVGNDLDIDGNITISGTVQFGVVGKTLKYISGVVTTTGSTLLMGITAIYDTAGIVFNNVTLNSSTTTYTLNSLLNVSGTLLVQAFSTFTGTSGFICGTLSISNSNGHTITLASGLTYTVTTALLVFATKNGSSGVGCLITSDHATNRATFNLVNGASCNCNAHFTRIDSSAGRTINSFNGTVVDCLNIQSFTDLKTVAYHFV